MTDDRYGQINDTLTAAYSQDCANDDRMLAQKFLDFAPTPIHDAAWEALSQDERAEYTKRKEDERADESLPSIGSSYHA